MWSVIELEIALYSKTFFPLPISHLLPLPLIFASLPTCLAPLFPRAHESDRPYLLPGYEYLSAVSLLFVYARYFEGNAPLFFFALFLNQSSVPLPQPD